MSMLVATVVSLILGFVASVPVQDQSLELLILHNNDMHARFEQTSKLGGTCKVNDTCYGGFARVAHVVREARRNATNGSGPPVLYLNAGDTYQGTPWYSLFKWNITSRFLNALSPDAISLGNHEFDDNVKGLTPFLNHSTFPILAANLDLSKVPELQREKQLMKSFVFDIKGVKVGVIGYLTPATKQLSYINDVEYIDEVPAINEEASLLKSKGVNILIALGHSGFVMDKKIARECPDIDVVIGGHTNTFLWNGEKPDFETPEGPYPVVVTQKSGRKVPVVQAYAYTKYLGKLHLQFNKAGELFQFDGQPLLLNESTKQDQDILDLLEIYRPGIDHLMKSIVGRTKVLLDGNYKNCRRKECNLGNLITDSMVNAYVTNYNGPTWSDLSIAFLQGGGIRNSIDTRKNNGDMTAADILVVLPFDNSLIISSYKGKDIKEALEWSVFRYDSELAFGEFLQMSGLKVIYNVANAPGNRVVDVQVLCTDCDVPEYEPLDLNATYKIMIPIFLAEGGDGFQVFRNNVIGTREVFDVNDFLALQNYIQKYTPVYPAVEGRIIFIDGDNNGSSSVISINFALLFVCFIVKYI